MALTPGTRIGPYEILSALGAGGMGEVYRARDTKLNREIAIKVLPDAFANDPERLARFTREAQTLAALNHPGIGGIHGLEEASGVTALVMELVEGEDLSQCIARGPIPLDEALPIGRQIAEALEAAHEQGIVHRDLKPANIKVRPDGSVKVLDFGLAKATEPVTGAPSLSQSPTLTSPAMMTGVGVILGTAAYMSPEQAKGGPADKRSDIWAFGCVLYEMLTGKRPFDGEDMTEVLGAVVRLEPNWEVLSPEVPPPIRTLLQSCLVKNRRRRVTDISTALFVLEKAASLAGPAAPASVGPLPRSPLWRRGLPWAVAACSLLAAGAAVALWAPWHTAPEPARMVFEVQGLTTSNPSMLAISPDGTHVITPAFDGDVSRLWIRSLARLEGVTLARTDAAASPFWSPDGHTVGFFADGKLKTVDIVGAPPQTIAEVSNGYGGTWNRDGVILFGAQFGPIYRVAASGGSAVPVTDLDAARGDTSHRFPRFLPDGVHFLYLVRSSSPTSGVIYVGSLASKEVHRLVDALNKPEFAPPDVLLFARESTLMGQRIDTSTFQVIGAPFRVMEAVNSNVTSGASAFSVSNNGVLAYRTGGGGDVRDLAWVDRSGKLESRVGAPAGYQNPRLSPDGQRLAMFKPEAGGDIWVTELERGTSTRFTLDPAADNVPLWSPDSARIAFVSNRDGGVFNIYQKNAGGTGPEELLLKSPYHKQLNDWSPDGRYLLYQEDGPRTKSDLWMLPLAGDRKPVRLLATPFSEIEATFSPDGRWIAYTSDESGTRQVYVQKFPTADRKWQVSSGRLGTHPRWGPDGKELFFDAGGTMMAVSVTRLGPGDEIRPGAPKRLFDGLLALPPHNFDVAHDGRRFLVLLSPGIATTRSAPITVVVNWKSGLSLGR